MTSYEDLAGAMSAVARALLTVGVQVPAVKDPASIGSGFGRDRPGTIEVIGHSFSLVDPLSVVLERPSRPVNKPYLAGNLLWTLSASNRLDDIAYYNSQGLQFGGSGTTLDNAWGPRIFGSESSQRISPFAHAIALLREDPSTRRAAIPLITQGEISQDATDVSCAALFQMLLRNGRLDAVAVMRSQSAMLVLPYDVFLFTGLQGIAAAELGVPLGTYTHMCTSLHYYKDEEDLVQSAVDGELSVHRLHPLPDLDAMSDLLRLEAQFRRAAINQLPDEVERAWRSVEKSTPSFYSETAALLAAMAYSRLRDTGRAESAMEYSGPFRSIN